MVRFFTTVGVAYPFGEEFVVAGAQPAGEPEGPDLAGFEPVGEEPFVVRAVAVEFGEIVVHPIQGPGVADVDDGDRDEGDECHGNEKRRDGEQHTDNHDGGEDRGHEGDETPHDLPRIGVGVFSGEADAIVEAGVFEGFELDGGSDLEELVHGAAVHEFAEQNPKFGR